MSAPDLKAVSKQMSWILRHEAERLGMELDPEGYVTIAELVKVMRRTEPQVTEQLVRAAVEQVELRKQRFSIVEDSIRANYGHSLEMRIDHQPVAPTDALFHGTTLALRPLILEQGLRPMQRQYVHLTPDLDLARSVGGRHGKPCLLRVDAVRAHGEGLVFYKANRSFWLAGAVPAQYLSAV